jgi:hypothetical protein
MVDMVVWEIDSFENWIDHSIYCLEDVDEVQCDWEDTVDEIEDMYPLRPF